MNKEEKEMKDLADTYKALTPENRANLLEMAHVTKAAQINTLKSANRHAQKGKKSA